MQERFRNVISSYFKGANGILLIFDITSLDSFKVKILIGNKCDLEEEREISKDEGEAFAMRNGMQYIETSTKINTNCNESFEDLAKIMIEYNNKKLCN